MRLSALLYMYRRRLRSHGLQELLAGVGVVIAVALVFTALLSESSIGSSAARVVKTVIGPASLQLRARSSEGISEAAVLPRVKRLPGVKQAAPLLEDTATITTTGGRHVQVQLAGTDLRLAVLDGLAETLPIGSLSTQGIGISRATAQTLRISDSSKRSTVSLKLRGRSYPLKVTAVLGPEAAGALSGAYIAVMPLARMQQLAGLPGRVSRIFIQTRKGDQEKVKRELSRIADGRLEVAPADQEITLLDQALAPSGLASGLFAAIGALLGFLLAFNAMLLTAADRRRAIADLRVAGARRTSVIEMVTFQALCLAIPASLLGIGAGYLLSSSVFTQSTSYLAEAFTLSPATVIAPWEITVALTGGILATCAASAVPLLDLRRGRARDAIYAGGGVPGNTLSHTSKLRLAATALCLTITASVLWVLAPATAIAATALLALATVLAVPLAFAAVLAATSAFGERVQRLSIVPLALASLRATTVRSLALAATGAVALFGTVALGGARENLLSGISTFAHNYVADAAIWVTNPGDNQAVQSFTAGDSAAKIAAVSGVARVESFQGGFVQLGDRRVWIIARPPGAERRVLASQLREGNAATANAQLAHGGWIAISQQIATEHHLHLGSTLTIPSATGPARFKIAATTTNLAWPPGVIFMNAADYSHAFATTAPTALGVQLAPGANANTVRTAIAAALGPASGLEVSLAATRAKRIEALASEGLGQLGEVATMLLIAAIVAMIAALASSIWQRRAGLASLRLLGASRTALQAILLLEALLMLGAGCLTGAIAGVYGQVVIDAFLRHVTGFPLASPTTSARPVEIFAIVLAAALIASTIPGWLAARVRPGFALANE